MFPSEWRINFLQAAVKNFTNDNVAFMTDI